MPEEHINSTSKSSYLAAATDAKARAEMDWGINYHLNKKIDKLFEVFGEQPSVCSRRFVTRFQAYVAGAVLLGLLIGLGFLELKDIFKIL